MQNTEVARYKGPQQDLYNSARVGWKNYSKYQPEFNSFRPRYTTAYAQERLDEIELAQKMQTNNASSGTTVKSHLELADGATECMSSWQFLKRYILDVYSGPTADAMLKAAGQTNYATASNNNWASVQSLMNEGSVFIDNHLNELVANNNMPPAFVESFAATKTNFTLLYDQYLDDTGNSPISVQERVKANNVIFDLLTKMLQDCQQIFAKNEVVRQQFVFANLKALVSGVGQAGVHGIVTDANTGLPIAAATIATANNINVTTTDDTGRYDLLGLAAGDYTISISAAGYVAQSLLVTVKTGTFSTQNIVLLVAAAG